MKDVEVTPPVAAGFGGVCHPVSEAQLNPTAFDEALNAKPGNQPAPALDHTPVVGQVTRERRRADAANARANRESRRADQAVERAAIAEARLAAFEASAAWRVTWPLRRLAHAIPRPLYSLIRYATPRPQQGVAGQAIALPPLKSIGATSQPIALLIDDNWPRPDRDAGSIEIVNLAEALMAVGYKVLFAATRDATGFRGDGTHANDLQGRNALAARGVHCLGPENAPSMEVFLQQQGTSLAVVVLNRVYCGGRFMADVRCHCTGARVIFNTIDLHHLRLQREADITGNLAGFAIAEQTRAREEDLAREADATIVVSELERDVLAASAPDANIIVLPLARDVRLPVAPFELRSGVGFIGGFAHAPNLDALQFFLAEVWPLVLKEDPGCEFSIVGAGLPASVLDGAPGAVCYLGAIPDTTPWFESLRVTVAPLRYGAGVKGKVVSSLAAGVPCVGTPTALEGIGLPEGAGALEAVTPEQLARQVLQVSRDAQLWAQLSVGGLAHVAARFSRAAWCATLTEALWMLDALPETARRPAPG